MTAVTATFVLGKKGSYRIRTQCMGRVLYFHGHFKLFRDTRKTQVLKNDDHAKSEVG